MVWSHNDQWMLTADHGGFVKYWQSNMNNVKMYQAHKEAIRGLRLGLAVTSCGIKSHRAIASVLRCLIIMSMTALCMIPILYAVYNDLLITLCVLCVIIMLLNIVFIWTIHNCQPIDGCDYYDNKWNISRDIKICICEIFNWRIFSCLSHNFLLQFVNKARGMGKINMFPNKGKCPTVLVLRLQLSCWRTIFVEI
jgi:hypothetical protein